MNNQHRYNHSYIFGISFISALGGYLFGFDFAVISGALPFLQKQFGLNAYWEGFATGSLALAAILGCLITIGLAIFQQLCGINVLFIYFGKKSLTTNYIRSKINESNPIF